ncbi:MAG TPA: hypothetical protein VLN59_16575 [Burkholderiales bacterium]|nr:hypothetical protein [Burkholderiales bacterium]
MEEAISPPSDIWVFRHETDGWYWQRTSITGEEVARSRTAFPDMEKCVEDATRHGYVATTPA